ncbi:MAG: hypothetical protein KKF62_19285 [Bacteroidetes bacterium]|nr:hypothetical protein [Bacteroidota bacterium]MBU1114526.1 hypothetical protein [Bacteroidota bacterium]MBU1799710.1 hypothetical protein [Bacteroidota bacterium]
MKNKLLSLMILGLLFSSLNISAQQVTVSLNVFDQLAKASFAAFLSNTALKNTPRILQVVLTPQDEKVIVKGVFLWRKLNESSFNEILNFTTKPFPSRSFYNDNYPDIEESNYNDDLIQENRDKGEPTGTYRVIIEVFDSNMVFQGTDTKDLEFTNPSQTIFILQPNIGDELDLGGILMSWTGIDGVSDYIVRANIRTSKKESLEEALKKGDPIVNDKNVGIVTDINLRDILDRELVGGEEIVVQVKGTIQAPGGETYIESEIVNFRIKGSVKESFDKGTEEGFTNIIKQVADGLKTQSTENGEGQELLERLENLLDKIGNGEINFNDLTITMGDGRRITYQEFQQILDYLRKNPDLLTNLNFEEK